MTEPVRITRLEPSDASALASALAGLVTEEERGGPVPHPRYLSGLLADHSNYVFLAWYHGAPVGYLSAYRFPRVERSGDQVYLFNLEVAQGARRSGIGQRLLASLLQACRDDGVLLVWAGTALDNVAAQRTFAAVGGRRSSETYVEYEFSLREL